MTEETKHLWRWFFEWHKRAARTLWHIINRQAYYEWRKSTYQENLHFDILNDEEHGL